MQSGKIHIVGNWKMNGDAASAHVLVEAVAGGAASLTESVQVVLCPPATLLTRVAEYLIGTRVHLGGQDSSMHEEGAYTGDISAAMLKDAGCGYVIAGHSERRQHHNETNEQVCAKAARAITSGLIPIICIGETEAERGSGKAEETVKKQLQASIPQEAGEGNFILAYEPVWAIGSGKTPSADDIRKMHAYIIEAAGVKTGLSPAQVSVLYGGSVKAANAAEILTIEGVSGVLVGGASLKAEEFCKIIAAA